MILNYAKKAYKDLLKKYIPKFDNVDTSTAVEYERIVTSMAKAQKFILPDGGLILDDKLKGITEYPKLPFPEITIEYYLPQQHEMCAAEKVFGREGTSICRKRIVHAVQLENNDILVYSIYTQEDKWIICPFYAKITKTVYIDNTGYFSKMELEHDLKTNKLPIQIGLQYGIINNSKSVNKEDWPKHAFIDLNDEIKALLELLEALSCSNIKTSKVKTKEPTVKNKPNKKPLFDTYHILTVDVSRDENDSSDYTERHNVSTGIKKREHLRRGHIRTYKSGLRIWIQNIVVNKGIGAKVNKIYDVRINTGI